MSHSDNNILVTGGAGYIGSHTCKAVAKAGYTPVTYDNLIYGHPWAVKWGPFEHGDIADKQRLGEVLKQYKPIAVIHFAAFAYVGESMHSPAKYYRNNVAGTLNLLETMRDQGVLNIVFSSTCATYGIPNTIPITEDHIQNPINPYGKSKLMVEHMLNDFDAAYGLKSVALRYFNAAGADPDGEIGELHEPETHLIPLVIEAALGKRDNITVFGTDYDTPDGTCVRDYIHVNDLADAHVLALKHLHSGGESKAFNLSNGNGFSILEVIKQVEQSSGKKISTVMGERREGDPARLVGDAQKISKELGWKPNFAGLDAIVNTALAWHTQDPK